MQIRCYKCHTPFSLNREIVHAALDEVHSEGLNHYNAICPKCRRVNKLSKKQLKHAAPTWKPTVEAEQQDTTDADTPEETESSE